MYKQCLPTIPPIQQHEQLPLTSNQPELGQTQTSDRVKPVNGIQTSPS